MIDPRLSADSFFWQILLVHGLDAVPADDGEHVAKAGKEIRA
jgi:hypothetical protein